MTGCLASLSQRYGRRWLIGAAIYVLAVSTLAAAGDTRSAAPLLAAVVLAMPCGVGAFVGVYFVYAVSSARRKPSAPM